MSPTSFLSYVLTYIYIKSVVSNSTENSTKEMVLIKPHAGIKYFVLPTSDEPVTAWIDIQRGIYPNTTYIDSTLEVGEPITIFIYMKDPSKLYDIIVSDCWAYDEEDSEKSKYALHLTEEHTRKRKLIDKWLRIEKPKGSSLKSILYTELTSFKFPDKDQVYLKCNIQLCFKSCDDFVKKAAKNPEP